MLKSGTIANTDWLQRELSEMAEADEFNWRIDLTHNNELTHDIVWAIGSR